MQAFDLATGSSVMNAKASTTVTCGRHSRLALRLREPEGVGAAPGKVDVFDLKTFTPYRVCRRGSQAGGIAFWKMEKP